ncbi:MAG: biotin carboxylase, partial [Alphaproteobacteria bacterium]|nr:biotin carboxylase [Alphaproteobacteria bacterium]
MSNENEAEPRADLARVLAARAARLDADRPDAVARQDKRGLSTIRAAITAFTDADSFVEYGGLAAPPRSDMGGAAHGVVTGTATVDGAAIVVVGYDYKVHARAPTAIYHRK